MKARSKFSNRTIASGLFALGLLIQPLLIRAQWDYGNTSMISDLKARGIGDILTVVIQETKETSKNTQAKSSKSSGIDASIQSLFYPPSATSLLKKKGELPALKLNSSSQFQGGGNISSSERIASRISVRVVDVLPNRHFLVEGTQLTSFGGETQEAILKGVVRELDITPGNTVFSYNLSDVTIRFASKGPITSTQKKGWFNSAWDKVSPF
jgi:flagellar L-ring protein precursor FlgH